MNAGPLSNGKKKKMPVLHVFGVTVCPFMVPSLQLGLIDSGMTTRSKKWETRAI